MKTRRNWFSLIELLVVVAICGILAAMLPGCKGMGKCPDEAGIGRTIKAYEINIAPNARSIVNIGNAGQNVPMYQETEQAAEGSAPYYTGGQMPASAGTGNAGTAQGKYVIQTVNDGVKRAAETDLATAATVASGLQQSQVGQTAPQTQRDGASTGTQTQTSSPQQNDATQIAPNTPVSTGSGTSQVTSPTATQAGSGSTPGAVTGGSGAGTQTGATTTTPATTTSGTSTATEATTTTGTTTN